MDVHIRYNGESHTLNGEEFGLTKGTSERNIKSLLSEIYGIPDRALDNLVVDRNTENIVIRPQAVFG